jgi:hypothetical protein
MFVPHQLLYFTGLRCWCVCPTPIALFHRFKMLLCFPHKAIGVGQTQQHLKPVKSNNNCVQTQQHLKPMKSNNTCVQTQQHLKPVHQLFYFTDLRCCCVCPTPIALFHRFKMCLYTTIVWFHRLKMLLCFSHTNCFISKV